MSCSRCRGMMVPDRGLDEIGRAALFIRRCILCGEIVDPVILNNRNRQSRRRELRLAKSVAWMKGAK